MWPTKHESAQYKGYAFCANEGQTKEEWLAEVQALIFLKQAAQNM